MKFLIMQSARISKKTYLELQKFKGGNFFFSFVKNHTFLFSGNWDWGRFKSSSTETSWYVCLKQGKNGTWLQNVFHCRNVVT